MAGDTARVDFDCPHCGMGFSMEAGEALFIDHVEDDFSEKCQSCGEHYQLRCASVHIEMECTKATQELDEDGE